MKKLFLYAFAAIVALASCAKEPATEGGNGPREKGQEVGYELKVGSEALSRYEMDKGGLANANPEELYMRYLLEVYSADGSELVGRYMRYEDFTDKENVGTNFRIRLLTDKYKVAVFAEFVPRSYAADFAGPGLDDQGYDQSLDVDYNLGVHFYELTAGGGLTNIEIDPLSYDKKSEAFYTAGRRMTRDAYISDMAQIDLLNEKLTGSLNLKRPLGRVEVYAKNMDPDRLTAAGLKVPDSISVTYPAGSIVSRYNVLERKSIELNLEELSFGHSLFSDDHPVDPNGELKYTQSNEEKTSEYDDLQLITFDYLFATPGTDFTTMVIKYFSEGEEIPGLETKIENIKVEANKRNRYVANPFGDAHNAGVVLKKADGTVLQAFDGDDALIQALSAAATVEGDLVIRLYAGEFKSEGITIDRNISLEGIGERTIIYGENPVAQTTSAGEHYGKNPILFIEGSDLNVSIKDVTFTIKNTVGPGDIDGLTIDGTSTLTLDNVIFDGIANMLPAYTPNSNLQGTCVTVMGGGKLIAENSTFKRFNKHAVEVVSGSAEMTSCVVTGDQYNAQSVYTSTPGDPGKKVEAAYNGHAVQNGFVFHTGTSGLVTGCHFSNITFGLDISLRNDKKNDEARAVKIFLPDASTLVYGADDETNTYLNCEDNWWQQEPNSNNAKLSDIKINDITVEGFTPNTSKYGVILDNAVATASISVTTDNKYASYTINPEEAKLDLAPGEKKEFKIEVIPETGVNDKQTYIVEVTRPKSTDATLKTLNVNGALVSGFVANRFDYEVTIGKDQPTAEVTFETTHSGAKVEVTPEEMPINLLNGESQVVTVVVTAEDEVTAQTYSVKVSRAASDNAKLSGISINGKPVAGFSPTTLDYNVPVGHSVTTADIVITKEDENATVIITPGSTITDLQVGETVEFTIEVEAQDGETTETYTVNVTRQEKSTNALLTGIMFDGVALSGFDPEQETYAINLAPGTDIQVEYTTASEYASAAIEQGNIFSLNDGETKVITIVVTAEDDIVTKTYTVTVTGEAIP